MRVNLRRRRAFQAPPPTSVSPLESIRLASLARSGVTPDRPSEHFDRIARLAAGLLQMPTSLVTVVDHDTQHVLGQNRPGVFVQARRDAFCTVVVENNGPLVVEDARADARFASNPLVQGENGIRFYAGAPLYSTDGLVLGALCVIDQVPRPFSPSDGEVLADLASVAADQLRLVRTSRHLATTAARHQHIVRVTSHDLRGALWAVDGFARLIADDVAPDSPIAEHAATLTEVSAQALHLLTELLDTAVLDTLAAPDRTTLDLSGLVGDAAATARPAAAAKRQTLTVEGTDAPVWVRAAETRLRQALDNLVSNAVKFTPPGGTVRLRVTPDGRASVDDSGPGIPPDRRADVFEPFVGLPNRPTSGEPTTGLGLSIAAQSIRVQGGALTVGDSAPRRRVVCRGAAARRRPAAVRPAAVRPVAPPITSDVSTSNFPPECPLPPTPPTAPPLPSPTPAPTAPTSRRRSWTRSASRPSPPTRPTPTTCGAAPTPSPRT